MTWPSGPEGKGAIDEDPETDTSCPDIGRIGRVCIRRLVVDHLRGPERPRAFGVSNKASGVGAVDCFIAEVVRDSEVDDLDISAESDENVLWLQIPGSSEQGRGGREGRERTCVRQHSDEDIEER
jgi:hypothetical protein